jgi:hypothetical protein
MPPVRNNQQKSMGAKFMDFIAKYWVWILGIIILLPWLIKYAKKMFASIEETNQELEKDALFRENTNPQVLNDKFDAALDNYERSGGLIYGTREQVKLAARQLADSLGTLYWDTDKWWSVFDPRGWTENDIATADILIENRSDINPIGICYTIVTRQHDLTADIIKYLNPQQKERVSDEGGLFFYTY